MGEEARRQIVTHAVRWTSNILVEVTNHHQKVLTEGQKKHLREAISSLCRFTFEEVPPLKEG